MAASGLTFLQIINRVLERMRESTVATPTDTDYSKLVSALINQVSTEIQEAWYWHAMRETYTVSAVTGTTNYALTNSGAEAVVISGWNVTARAPMRKSTVGEMDQNFFGVDTLPLGAPTEWLVAGRDANQDQTIDIYPDPIAASTLKFTVYVPQADLSSGSTVPLVPQNVLMEETIARLRAERGDENVPQPAPGETFILKDLLASAVARDGGRTDDTEMDWEVV